MSAADALVHAAERVLPRVPWGLQGPISEAVGTIAYLSAPRAREAVRANLSSVSADGSASVRRVFVNQVRQYLEVFQIPRIDRERFSGTFRLEGWEHFACAHERGKGVVLASAHFGPVALVGQIITTRGYELSLPIEPAESEFMRAVNRARGAQGFHLVPINSAFGIHRVLRRGGVLAFLADRAVSGVGERVEFFGRPALLPSAHVALALHTGAALVPAFAWREGRALVARIEEPLEIQRTGDREADVREGVRRFAALLQRYVAGHPEQWTVFEPVWRA